MSRNMEGLILSFAFVFAMIFIATAARKIFKLSNEASRKIIHVSVGNWIFFALYYFRDWYIAIIGPLFFIALNIISYNAKIFKAMELDDKNPGTIYYPISLTACTLLTYSHSPLLVLPYLGIVAMTWGDGLAAVFGKRWPIKTLFRNRTWGGSIAFVVVTFLASMIYLHLTANSMNVPDMMLIAGSTAVLGMMIELVSPKNLDNLAVPIIIGLLGYFVGR
ncbi:MAG: diacylglycerol/polyprenol kinase family protein [Candidatus Zhuqueibacterota bacterium]